MQIKAVSGGVNVPQETIVANVKASIQRGLPQVRPYQPQGTPLAIVCGGPSLLETTDELRDAMFRGYKVATVNGSHEWAIRQNIKPDLAIVMDARPGNAEFLKTPVPGCKYLIASQCAPETFDVVEGRDTWIFHCLSYDAPEDAILQRYYGKDHYVHVDGGSTVALRALTLLRILGFLRMDLFGFDSCWMGAMHHAYPQSLNDADKRLKITMRVDGTDDRIFYCAPWHLKQLEDFQLWVKDRGQHVQLTVHGDGLIAHTMRTGARLIREDREQQAVAVS